MSSYFHLPKPNEPQNKSPILVKNRNTSSPCIPYEINHLASQIYAAKKKRTKRELFLAEMNVVVPWLALEAVIEPYYPKAGKRGGQPKPMGAAMLRNYFMQNWFGLSDPGMEDALYEVESMRRFAGLELIEDALPDETTILNFRHLLEMHTLTAKLMNTINDTLTERSLLLKCGTMVDASIIHAPSSTKNADKARDPEMYQTKKGNQWYFGMKVHVGSDVNSGMAHTVSVTSAHVTDISELPNLLREDDRAVFGDKGYVNNVFKRAGRKAGGFGALGLWGMALKATKQPEIGISNDFLSLILKNSSLGVLHTYRCFSFIVSLIY